MLFVESQSKNMFFAIDSNCRISIDKGTSIHRIFIKFASENSSEELARYSSYDKAKQAYRDLLNYLTMDKQFKLSSFTMPEDTN